jgi:Transposase DDE domain
MLYRVGDSPLKGTRGPKPPVAHNTRLSQYHPDVFGLRMVIVMAQGDVDRLPLDVARLRRKADPQYQPEQALLRQMRPDFQRPAWCQEVVVTADAAYASRGHLALMQALGYGYVMALPRTWKLAHGKALKDLGTPLPRSTYLQIRLPTVHTPRRRTCWGYATRVRRRHLADVTVVLSTCRRNDGPKQTNILVTTLPETVTAREVVGVSLRRWWIELLMKERQGVVGRGQHQVTRKTDRVERAVAGAIMAYLLLLKLRAKAIPADRPWSALRRQQAFAWEVRQGQGERSAPQIARKWLQLGNAA